MALNKAVFVNKANGLIESSYVLSVQEQRVLLSAIAQIKKGDEVTDAVLYTVSVQDIADLANVDADSLYKNVKEAAIKLLDRRVCIIKEPDGRSKKTKTIMTGWVQTCTYCDEDAVVEIRFTKDILPYISKLGDNFTQFTLAAAGRLTTQYGFRLFELCMEKKGLGISDFELSIDDFRNLMMLNDGYPRIFDLKKWVLDPAIADVNENSEIKVSYGQRKRGRNVSDFQFSISLPPTRAKKAITERCPDTLELPLPEPESRRMSKHEFEKFAKPGESLTEAVARAKAQGHILNFNPFK